MSKLQRLWQAQGGRCFYCERQTWVPGLERKLDAMLRLGIKPQGPGSAQKRRALMATREHLIRKIDGGGGGNNLRMACQSCNCCRGETPVIEHKQNMMRKYWRRSRPPIDAPAPEMVTSRFQPPPHEGDYCREQ